MYKRQVVPWSSEDARRFLESARADGDAMYAAYVLVLVLGLRKGEVLGLRWDVVDFEVGELIIDHQLQRVRRELLYRETKTEASDASLPLPEIVATACGFAGSSRTRPGSRLARRGSKVRAVLIWCSPGAMGPRSIRGRSIVGSAPGVRRLGCVD